MYLLVQPNGARYWRMAYRMRGKQKLLALGVYRHLKLRHTIRFTNGPHVLLRTKTNRRGVVCERNFWYPVG